MATANSPQLEQVVPHSREAERAVLGCILLQNHLYAEVAASLGHANAFFVPAHRRVFEAMGRLAQGGQAIDPITLQEELQAAGELVQVGGPAAIAMLFDGVGRWSNVDSYLRTIREHALRREMMRLADSLSAAARDLSESPDELLERAQKSVLAMDLPGSEDSWQSIEQLSTERLQRIEEAAASGKLITGTATGYADLDYLTCGLQPGELIYVAGRPSMGKSAFAFGLALNAALHPANEGKRVAIFSLEMSAQEVVNRFFAYQAHVSLHALRQGMLHREGWRALAFAQDEIARTPIVIDDRPKQSAAQMRAKLRRLKGELSLVLVDYLSLMHLPGATRAEESSEKLRGEALSRELKALAKEFQVPVMTVIPLNKVDRSNPKPTLGDVAFVGGYEPDLVILIHRDEYYKPDTERQNIADIIIAKQRNGPTGEFEMVYEKQSAAFRDNTGRSNEIYRSGNAGMDRREDHGRGGQRRQRAVAARDAQRDFHRRAAAGGRARRD